MVTHNTFAVISAPLEIQEGENKQVEDLMCVLELKRATSNECNERTTNET
jgi:hypothetical protein